MSDDKDYSELVERLRKSHWKPAPECLEAIAALQRRVVRAEAVVEAARGINTFAWASMTADCNEARDEGNRRLAALKDTTAALDRLAEQDSEQEKPRD